MSKPARSSDTSVPPITVVCLFSMLFVTLSSCCFASDTIRINGSGSALDMLKPLVKAYQKTNRNVRVEIEKPLGSTRKIVECWF